MALLSTTSNKVLRLEVARDPDDFKPFSVPHKIRPAKRHTPLAFTLQPAEHCYMTPATKQEPTAGAVRASKAIQRDASLLRSLPELIDRETGVREILEILENVIAEAGDLIEARNPELAAQARAALRRYADEALRQAE